MSDKRVEKGPSVLVAVSVLDRVRAWRRAHPHGDELSMAYYFIKESEMLERALDRFRHGVPIEGDYVCPDSVELDAAKKEIEKLKAERHALVLALEERESELSDEVTVTRNALLKAARGMAGTPFAE